VLQLEQENLELRGRNEAAPARWRFPNYHGSAAEARSIRGRLNVAERGMLIRNVLVIEFSVERHDYDVLVLLVEVSDVQSGHAQPPPKKRDKHVG
jgi:hypothetical protein